MLRQSWASFVLEATIPVWAHYTADSHVEEG